MNREIKFRVWDIGNNSFIKDEHDPNFWINPFNFQTWMEFHPKFDGEMVCESKEKLFIFQQFTGLYDKNNKEIYEGDIIEAYDEIYEVAWAEAYSGWQFCLIQDGKFNDFYGGLGSTEYHEVIGNINERNQI